MTFFVIYALAHANADLRLEVRHTGLGNLAAQLDAMSGLGPGSAGAYRDLWEKQLKWSQEDETALNTWRDTWRKYQGRSKPMPIPRPAPLPIGVAGLDPFQRCRQLLQDSAAPDAFKAVSKSLISSTDLDAIMGVLNRLWPRFQDWYSKTAAPQLDTSKSAIQAAFVKHELLPLYKKVAAFYGSELDADALVKVNLVMRPAWNRQSSGAQQIGSYSIVEIAQGEAPDNRLDVVSHELFHYFYHEAAPLRQLEVAEWFAERAPEGGAAAYNLLNEAIATALGNGVVSKQLNAMRFERTLAMPLGFYADAYIDRTAKAVLADVESALAKGTSLNDKAFLAKYLTAFQKANEGETERPILLMRSFFACADETLFGSARELMGVVRPGFGSLASPANAPGMIQSLDGFRAVTVAIFVPTNKIEALSAWEKHLPKGELDKVRERAKTPGAFMAAIPRSPGVYAFIFVGDSPKDLQPLVEKFAQLRSPPTNTLGSEVAVSRAPSCSTALRTAHSPPIKSPASTPANEPRKPIRVYLRRTTASGHLVARVSINGRFEGNMVIDTGATVNFLSDRTARRLGLKMSALQNEEEKPLRAEYDGGSNARFSVIDRLEMGDLKLAKIPFLLVRGERMHAVAGEYVDGIIGLDLLKRFAARIDLSQHEMLLWLGGKLTAEELATVGADSQSIRLYVDKNRAEMVATINDEVRLKMLLDTGATKTVIQKDTSDALDLKSIGGVTRISTMYGPVETSQSRISTFTLGGVPIELPMIRFVLKGAPAKMPALLGLDVLSAQPILLDFPAERMYLLPAAK